MGFTDIQADQIYEAVTKDKRGHVVEHALSTLMALFVLGLNPSTVLKVLEKCPDLYHVKSSQLKQRIVNLRKLGLMEGSLQRVVSYYPLILTMSMKKINMLVRFLKEECVFTTQQVSDILRDSPAVVGEDQGRLQYMFQYAYFRMGVKQAEMVKARFFRNTLEEVRCRHCFLERRGLYQTPDKKGQTLILNPKLKDILSVDLDTFLKDFAARATEEEYQVFQTFMAREWFEEEERPTDAAGDEDVVEEDEDEEEDEREEGRSSYMKRRKR
ncbi:transcription termination factor 4, mitochondrial [Aplochiton taeniatus]